MLEIKNISVSYPDGTAPLKDFSLEIHGGENVALVGANGEGKTTLMLTLTGIIPHSGSISVSGITLDKNTVVQIRQMVGMVFQNPDDQLFTANIFDDVAFGPRNMGLAPLEVDDIVEQTLERLNIAHLKDRSPLRLSGGEKRLAAIATVLAMEPQFILFDEPAAFLDLKARRGLINLLKTLPQAKLIAGHDLQFLTEVCTRTVIIKDGRVFADGTPEALFGDDKLMFEAGLS